MTNHYSIPKESSQLEFNPLIPPVLRVSSGDIVAFETDDSQYARLRDGEIDPAKSHGTFNRVTGPVAVEGATPGECLRLEILEIVITRVWAVWFADDGTFRNKQVQIQELSLHDGRVRINERLSVPLSPMIGCIGLAPAAGTSSAFVPVYPWGGNMDLPELKPSAVLYLPVQTPGALLSVGDLHAAMGRGEPLNVGLEAGGRAVLRITVEHGMRLPAPRIELEGSTFCVGCGATFSQARKSAMKQAYHLLTSDYDMSPFDAFAFAAARVNLRFGGPAACIILAEVPDPTL